ncbi:MAG: cytochrome P450 [Ardenticatenaceae bacterium]|nr:cytochrome P450 [Ardenticatenaceae bacterium]
MNQKQKLLAVGGLAAAGTAVAYALNKTKPATNGHRPPGPPLYPVIGMTRRLDMQQHEAVLHFQHEFGDFVHLQIVHKRLYLVSDPAGIKHVLQDNNHNYVKGLGLAKAKVFLGEGLLTNEGEPWRRQRRLIQPAFHRQKISGFAETMTAVTSEMLAGWETAVAAQRPLNIAQEMMRLTLGIVAQTLFSTALTPEEMDTVGRVMPHVLHVTNQRIQNVFAFWERLPTPANRRFMADLAALDRIVYRIIAERRETGGEQSDLLGMLMAARDEETGAGMDDKQLRDEVMTLFLAGHETTANLLAWTWYLLSLHPDVRARLQEEVDGVLNGRIPTSADVPNLTYTTQVLHEVLRLYPPAAIFSRTPLAADEVSGYAVEPGSVVIISPYVMHRHPDYWQNPAGFQPDRFAPGWERNLPRYVFIPFGGGPRLCIGNNFALMEAALIVAMVAQKYELDLVPGHPVEAEFAVTLRPRYGVQMMLRRRG